MIKRIEWPTVGLALACTGAWAASIYAIGAWGWWWLVPVAVLAVVLHSSLQHEALHGHPTNLRFLNEALVFLPVGLAYPFRRFKALHLQHHDDEALTDPFEDPESSYMSPADWQRTGVVMQNVRRFNNTQVGRLLIGPTLSIIGFVRGEARLAAGGNRPVLVAWVLHLAGMAPVWWWVSGVCGIHPLVYILFFAYPALSVLSIRTFIEHQAVEAVPHRTIINEDRGLLALLFLNNSLHFVHHSNPTVAWYRLPLLYRERREEFLARNGGYLAASYGEVFRRFALVPKGPVPHPLMAKGDWRRQRTHA